MTVYKSDTERQCIYCHDPIFSYGIIDSAQQYYHLSCYEDHIEAKLQAIKVDVQTIVHVTQSNNSQANSLARRILRNLDP